MRLLHKIKSANCFLPNKSGKILIILLCVTSVVTSRSVQMRVVKDTASYGYFGHNIGEAENNQLATTIVPANFSGPVLLQRLIGKCYNYTQNQYRYMLCPFQNFSQYELSSRWNAYRGVLGVWSHWHIKNNTFSSMVYNHGDRCGEVERSVEVHILCGPSEVLSNVSEPSRCTYSAIFYSKYVCHNDSVLVYPRLPSGLRRDWDQLLTDYSQGDITEKGYNSDLEKIFQSAGLLQNKMSESPGKLTTEAPSIVESLFTDLAMCNKEYKNLAKEITRLNQEIDTLKLLLDLAKIENRTAKPPQ